MNISGKITKGHCQFTTTLESGVVVNVAADTCFKCAEVIDLLVQNEERKTINPNLSVKD